MRKFFLTVLFLRCLVSCAQTMTAEEKKQREDADFTALLSEVRKNSTKGCLCNTTEYVVFSFVTKASKTASLCISKNASATKGYMAYRFGTKAKIEFSFPSDTLNSFSQFSLAHYNRGGGKQNAAMYVNSLHFVNGGYRYTLHDDWNSEDDHYSKGILITNEKTGKASSIDAKGKATGTLWSLVSKNIVKESDEL